MNITTATIHPYMYVGITPINLTSEQIFENEKQKIINIFGIADFIDNRTRLRDYVWLRHIFFYKLVLEYKISPTKLEVLSKYDRTTILHSIKSVKDLMLGRKPDKEFMEYAVKYGINNIKKN
jgi:hypothetical protein